MTSIYLPLTVLGSNPIKDFEFFHVERMLMVLLRCPYVPEKIYERAPDVFLHLTVKLKSDHMTSTVLVNKQPNIQIKKYLQDKSFDLSRKCK
jgi:hypothetical protein